MVQIKAYYSIHSDLIPKLLQSNNLSDAVSQELARLPNLTLDNWSLVSQEITESKPPSERLEVAMIGQEEEETEFDNLEEWVIRLFYHAGKLAAEGKIAQPDWVTLYNAVTDCITIYCGFLTDRTITSLEDVADDLFCARFPALTSNAGSIEK